MKDMLGVLVRKVVNLPIGMIGTICDLAEKLSGEAGQVWLAELKKFLRKEKCWIGVVREIFLKLISASETLTIDACDGTKILADAKDTFAYIDSDLKNWGADEKGLATDEAPVEVYEMANDGMFSQLFGSLSSDVQKLCLTQNQIIGFVKKHHDWLRTDGYGTFFLFKSNNHFFVAHVRVPSVGRLFVHVSRFERDDVWYAESRHRFVVPQLAETL